MQFDLAAFMLLSGINDTMVIGPGIDMQTYGPLAKFRRIIDFVYRLGWIYGGRRCRVHLNYVAGSEITGAILQVLGKHFVVLHQKPANRYGHPAILLFMVVDRTALAGLPTNGQQFIQW